ncbi:MAG: hypothetical protein WBV26_02200 [Candidatus Sulfotelmatobacter sp.]|jgi:hypothetical protein
MKRGEKKRLGVLQGESRNLAKRYKLTAGAIKIIKQAAKIHGQQSRAIQIAVEVIWRTPEKNYSAPAAILETPLTGKTYILPPRTVRLIEVLASKFGTRGNVLAACAYLLLDDMKQAEEWGEITPPRQQK